MRNPLSDDNCTLDIDRPGTSSISAADRLSSCAWLGFVWNLSPQEYTLVVSIPIAVIISILPFIAFSLGRLGELD